MGMHDGIHDGLDSCVVLDLGKTYMSEAHLQTLLDEVLSVSHKYQHASRKPARLAAA